LIDYPLSIRPLRCPVCDRTFFENDHSVAMPFCSRRCKQIDAGRWLGEAYGLPIEVEEETPDNTNV